MLFSRVIRKGLPAIGASVFILMLGHSAMADDACMSLAQNDEWNKGMSTMSKQITQNEWDKALKSAESLNAICDRSPILNYAMGRIYRQKGDETKALYYMQRATRYTEEFAVKGNTLEQMWFDRYETEHPDARPEAIAARRQELDQRQQEIEKNRQEIDALRLENTRLQGKVGEATLAGRLDSFEDAEAERRHYAAGLWTGVAVGGVGLALAATGAALLATQEEKDIIEWPTIDQSGGKSGETKISTRSSLSLGLLGAGIGLTVAGAVFAGIFGYHYANLTKDSNVSFNLSPMSADVSFKF